MKRFILPLFATAATLGWAAPALAIQNTDPPGCGGDENDNDRNPEHGCGGSGGGGGGGDNGGGGGGGGGAGGSVIVGDTTLTNTSTNTNTNTNQQSQDQTQEQSLANTNTNDASNSTNVTVQGDTTIIRHRRIPVSTAYAAPLTSGLDTCLGSFSAGGQTSLFGLSFGSTKSDKTCELIKLSREAGAMGMADVQCQILALDRRFNEALTRAGRSCALPPPVVAAAPAPVEPVMPPPPPPPLPGPERG